MAIVRVQRLIEATAERVFVAVAEPQQLMAVNPDVVGVDFLDTQRSGKGTCFRETRLMNGKPAETELEITEYEAPTHVRMIADSHGTVWDTVFDVTPEGDGVRLDIVMDARAHKLLPRLLNPLFKGLFRKGLVRHIDAVQAWCEAGNAD